MRILPFCIALLAAFPAHALRPGIPRVTGFSDHFSLTIDASKSELLPDLAALAESCWTRQSRAFEYRPAGRIQLVFLDEEDYANGFAYSAQQWVIIHLRAAEFLLRGTTPWLPNVMAHEIGHVFTLRKMGDDSRFLGWDAFHNWIGRGPSRFAEGFRWEAGNIPPWLAEGLAQYAAAACGFDTLDNRRRMELRVAAASGGLLTPAELRGFAWDARRNEMIYAQGYSLVSWLAGKFGPPRLNEYMRQAARVGWRRAFPRAFGRDLSSLYGEWRKELEAQARYLPGNDGETVRADPPGPYAVETFPAPLGDGRYLYLSARDNDYGATDLFLADGEGGSRKLFRNVTSLELDAQDGKAYFTATRYRIGRAGVRTDLYAYSLRTGAAERLTGSGGVVRGCAAGGKVYALRRARGRTTVDLVADGRTSTLFTAPDSFEIIDLAPGRAPGRLVLVTTSGFGGDLRELDLAAGGTTPLAVSPQDEIHPHWSGDTLYYSADYGGAYDIYALAGGTTLRLTQVDGGAFHPRPAADGIWISAYGPGGFRLARARLPAATSPYFAGLPVPGWDAADPVEFEADAFDHSRLSVLGYGVSLGVLRQPGFRNVQPDSFDSRVVSAGAGNRALAAAALYWTNPNGSSDAALQVGVSIPLDYEGPTHLDRSSFDIRVRAFTPELSAGIAYMAWDFPDLRINGRPLEYWQAELESHFGADLRLSEHWAMGGRVLGGKSLAYAEGESEGGDFHLGYQAGLDYFDRQWATDGVVKGLTAFAEALRRPRIAPSRPELEINSGATAYASLFRRVYFDAGLYHTYAFADTARSWMYGGGRAYFALPLGLHLGTRGGAGLYLDRLYPTVQLRGMARFSQETGGPAPGAAASRREVHAYGGRRGTAGIGTAGGRGPGGPAQEAFLPNIDGYWTLVDRALSRELGAGLTLKLLAFSGRPAWWSAFVYYDAADFGREPAWAVSISL